MRRAIPSRYLIAPLPGHLKLREFAANPGSGILLFAPDSIKNAKAVVYRSKQRKTRATSNLVPLKIDHD